MDGMAERPPLLIQDSLQQCPSPTSRAAAIIDKTLTCLLHFILIFFFLESRQQFPSVYVALTRLSFFTLI